ncbi:hypothetical protein LEP1GSC193_3633 [Leptospira alstonii serovar Pingchang str. 80-412]|uniref:Uncharacterized protein n=2 Tax=Leptospira alstonii TaxID=28452 RepID=M6D7W7_9LEPT|nr:hypothetical protein LEP1GSC194_0767 [Leptospira alstonii serovar Sichuan str. 79601]EQA81316.1 hypothetical protein LEP1GSC193_3633 [Leptospira alstonii serovar Pingchang str. 80-412]
MPSKYVPIAKNCFVEVVSTVELVGDTAIEDRGAAPTFTLVLPVTDPNLAEIVYVPIFQALANPLDTVVLL